MTGAASSGSSTLSSSGGGDGVANGNITIPDVSGLTREQAIAALQRAGFQGNLTDDQGLCGSVVQGRVIERGIVCNQSPSPGREQGARLPISITVQTENPWHGNAGLPTEWHLMPNVVGMPLDQARAEMQRVGFRHEDKVALDWVDTPSCKPLTVCEIYPSAFSRAGINSSVIISARRDPNAKPPTPEQVGDSAGPRPADAPKAEAKPEPFF